MMRVEMKQMCYEPEQRCVCKQTVKRYADPCVRWALCVKVHKQQWAGHVGAADGRLWPPGGVPPCQRGGSAAFGSAVRRAGCGDGGGMLMCPTAATARLSQ